MARALLRALWRKGLGVPSGTTGLNTLPHGPRLRMELMVIPVGRSLFLKFAGRLARYADIDILKTSSAEEENILGNVAKPHQRRKKAFLGM